MAGGGQYTIRVHGVLDDTQIRAQLAAIQKEFNTMGFGGRGGKGTTYFAQTGKDAKKSVKSVKAYSTGMTQATKQNKKFGASTLDITKKVIQFGATTAVIRGVTSGMGDMVKNVYELDGALTEFKKVSDLSGKGLEKYTDQAYKVGKTVARTGTEMVQAATEFKKAGYNEKDSMELARVASMYQNVADVELTAGEAANFIVSQMKAFNMTAQDSEHIIDAVNEVSNNFAVSSADIATNIGKASAALATGNVTYEQSIGLMTAMTEVTRNGAKSARGLVSIQSRYNQIIDESSSTGKKLTAWYKEHNIAIKDQNGQLKSFFEVGGEVAKIWDTLSDNEKKYYLNAQAGANQSQNLAALMKNYKTALEATAKAEDASKGKIGSAAKENARYMESMEGKLKNLKSAWEDFSRKMIDSDMLKDAIDGLTKFVNFLTTDVGQGFVKAAAGAILFGGAVKLVGGLLSLVLSPLKSATKVFGLFSKSTVKATKGLKGYQKGLKVVKAPTLNGAKSVGKLGKSMRGLAAPTLMASGLLEGLGAILTNPAGLIAGMLALGAGIMYVNTKLNEYNSPEKQYERTHKKLGELEKRYDEVTDAIDRLNQKREEGGLTSSEETQLKNLENEKEQVYDLINEYKELEKAQKTQAARTPDSKVDKTDKVKQHMRPATKASPLGALAKQAEKDAGYVDLLTSKMGLHAQAVQDLTKANQKYQKAVEDRQKAQAEGKDTTKYTQKEKEALDEVSKAYDGIGTSMEDLKKANQELKEFYGSQERMPDDIRKSSEAVDKMVKSYDDLVSLSSKDAPIDFSGMSGAALDKTIDDFKNLGESIGISVDEAGKLTHVNFDTMSTSMETMGYTAEETRSALQMLGEQHPEATFEIEGVDVAGKDIDTVLEYLDKVDGDDAEATMEINGSEVAVSDIKDVQTLMDIINGKTSVASVELQGGEASANQMETVTEKGEQFAGRTFSGTADVNAAPATAKISQVNQAKIKDKTGIIQGNNNPFMKAVRSANAAKVNDKHATISASLSSGFWSVINKAKAALASVHLAKGTPRADEGFAEVNELGYEYIRDAKTGELRVANGGKRGVTYLSKGDTVYTHGQSLRMKQEAKEPLPQFKKGKKGKVKSVTKKQYNKAIKKIREKYEKELDKLEYQRDVKHWTDEEFAREKEKLYKKYEKKIANYNKTHKIKAKKKKDRKKKTGLGTENKRDLGRTLAEVAHDNAVADIESAIDDYLGTAENLATALKKIEAARKAQEISADEALELQKQAYKANVDYNMKLLEQGKLTYKELAAIIEEYYKAGMLTEKEYYEYLEEAAEEYKNQIIDKMEKIIDEFYDTVDKSGKIIGGSFEDALAQLRDLAAEGQLTVEEALELERQLYSKHLASMFNAYQYDKKTYNDMKNMIEDYYNAGKLSAEDYYDYLQQLADEQMDKEKARIGELQQANSDKYDLAKMYVQQQIDLLEKQNEELDDQNELIELQNNLEKAKAKRVRVYKEGVGFVYEQDREAIEEAQKALIDYQKEQDSPELKAWKDVLELFDQQEVLANIKELEVRLGSTVGTLFGAYGTSTTAWTEFIKNSLATDKGYEALLEDMDKVTYWDDVLSYLNGSGQVDSSTLADYFSRYQYDSNITKGATSLPSALNSTGGLVKTQVIPNSYLNASGGGVSGLDVIHLANDNDSYVYNFDSLVLPNVDDANSLVNELKNLPNKALQYSGSRA